MGEIRKYICQDCGNAWERMEGVGMMSIIYHCDKCGDEKQIEPMPWGHAMGTGG